MIILSYVLMITGGITGYFGGIIIKKVFDKEISEKSILCIKFIGFLLVLTGVILLFVK